MSDDDALRRAASSTSIALRPPATRPARRGRGGHRRRRHHGRQHRLPPRGGRGHRRGRARTGHPRLGVVGEAAGRRPGHVLRRQQRRARAAEPARVRDLRRRASASTSASARSATCSCAAPRPSWRQWRPASGCRTDSAATSRMVTPAEACDDQPDCSTPGPLLGASFSPRDGYAEPARVVEGYARAATRLGVRCCEHTEVLELATDATGAHQVRTQRGMHHRRAR